MSHVYEHRLAGMALGSGGESGTEYNWGVYRATAWRQMGFGAVLVAADAAAALVAPKFACLLIGPAPTLASGIGNWLAYAVITVAAMLLGGLYAGPVARAPLDHAVSILRALVAAHVIILLRFALLRQSPAVLPVDASIIWAGTAFGLAAGMIVALRVGLGAVWQRFGVTASAGATALVMSGWCDRELRQRLDRLCGRRLGYMFAWGAPQAAGLRMIGDAESFAAMIRAGTIDDILVFTRRSDDAIARHRIDRLLASLADQPVRVRLAFDAVAEIGAGDVARGQSLRMVTVLDRPIALWGAAYKRGFDLLGGLALLIIFGPLMGMIALALRIGGPVLFRQERIGRDGVGFTVLKFRTMRPVATRGTMQARRGDARITRMGAVLRRLSLDELPQIFNVLRGDMSLVGPRPHAPNTSTGDFTFEQASAFYGVRHRVKPGLTGLAQVRGLRGPTAGVDMVAARVAADLEYIEHWSPWLDIAILLRTVPAVLGGENAF